MKGVRLTCVDTNPDGDTLPSLIYLKPSRTPSSPFGINLTGIGTSFPAVKSFVVRAAAHVPNSLSFDVGFPGTGRVNG
jgi:hypothetical protein